MYLRKVSGLKTFDARPHQKVLKITKTITLQASQLVSFIAEVLYQTA